ncbi:conserved hypothetical protein [Trichinella spiralis]|uniref:hypothetical protein n=1 Tax=Trichinella spiralis TaxID=6334 RepID=UPI0001EFECE5|nr:conserved hypothetical protein [Trichinella spiralis]
MFHLLSSERQYQVRKSHILFSRFIKYAKTIVADRETPALQWTKTRPFCIRTSSMKSRHSPNPKYVLYGALAADAALSLVLDYLIKTSRIKSDKNKEQKINTHLAINAAVFPPMSHQHFYPE